jgi:hypothetical protein
MTKEHKREYFMITTPIFFVLLFLYRYLPKKFLLKDPALALDQLNKHHNFVIKTKNFYKKLSAKLADMIFARSVKVEAPVQFESDFDENMANADEDPLEDKEVD